MSGTTQKVSNEVSNSIVLQVAYQLFYIEKLTFVFNAYIWFQNIEFVQAWYLSAEAYQVFRVFSTVT